MRYVSCREEDGSVAEESACTALPRPLAEEECVGTPCGRWKALDWSPVSEGIWGLGENWGAVRWRTNRRSQKSMGNSLESDLDCDFNHCTSYMCRWYKS